MNRSANAFGSGSQDAAVLCGRISEIKILPMKGERGEDQLYDTFMDADYAVVPCLIDRVTDTTQMSDPRQEPGFPDVQVRVGDTAYFLLLDITKLGVTEMLPLKVKDEYRDDGIYAYFKFVKNSANRQALQDRLRAWYQQTQKSK